MSFDYSFLRVGSGPNGRTQRATQNEEEMSPVAFPAPDDPDSRTIPRVTADEQITRNAQSHHDDELLQQNKESDANVLLVPHYHDACSSRHLLSRSLLQERRSVGLNEAAGTNTSGVARTSSTPRRSTLSSSSMTAVPSLLGSSLLDREKGAWKEKFRELESFKEEHGHVQIPTKYPPNQELSKWLQNQRHIYLNESSSTKLKCASTRERRRQQLKSLGVTFPDEDVHGVEKSEQDWQAKFSELEQYKEDHGDVLVPRKYPQNQKLSTWLRSQRCDRLNDNSSTKLKCAATRKQRQEQLRALGVTFPFEPPSLLGSSLLGREKEAWKEKFRELESFKTEHGHVQIPKKYPPNQKLSTWLKDQRYMKLNENSARKLKGLAARERRRHQLQSLGVTFPDGEATGSGRSEQVWQEKFRELESFKKEHGHVRVPLKYPQNPQLANWLHDQRHKSLNEDYSLKLKCATTRERRRNQLQSLGVAFPDVEANGHGESKEDYWQAQFSELESFKMEHGHVQIPQKYKYTPNQKLSFWLTGQRLNQLNEKSSRKLKCADTRERRRQQLQSLGVAFPNVQQPERERESEAEYTSETCFTELEPFQEAYRYGHVIVPVVNSLLHLRKRTSPDDDSSSTDSKKMRIDVFEC